MSDLPWLRLYTDTVDNEKIRLLAFEDRWHYIALLCLKQQGILDPKDPLLERKISIKLGIQIAELGEVKRRLSDVDLIDKDFTPIGWNKHQYVSDISTSRVRKHRENKKKKECNGDETLLKRKCNAIDTEQIQNRTEKENPKGRFAPPSLNEVTSYCLSRENSIDPESFVNFYESKGWMIGKNKMKSWKACVVTWEKRNPKQDNQSDGAI